MALKCSSENRKTLIATIVVLLVVGGIFFLRKQSAENNWSQVSAELKECLPKSDTVSLQKCLRLMNRIQSFDDCIAAGFQPGPSSSQCSLPDGRIFLQQINAGTSSPMQIMSVQDPYSKPGVIDIGWQWMLAEKAPGGIIIRGTWDKNEQGVFMSIPDADKFTRIKDAEGAPTPYFTAGQDIYLLKITDSSKKASNGSMIPELVLIPGADINTFVPGISQDFSYITKDKNHVYIKGIVDPTLDATTIEALPKMQYFNAYFFKDKNHVYDTRVQQGLPYEYKVTLYDPATFEMLKNATEYTRDKNGVYFRDIRIASADLNTFQVITNPPLSPMKGDTYPIYSYSKDANRVYYLGQVVLNADPKTFVPVDNGGISTHFYGKDSLAVYEGTTTIPYADPRTFKPLWYPIYEGCGPTDYEKDATHVFLNKKIVPGADPNTFEALINGYGKDKNGIWLGDKLDPSLPKDFKPECNYG